MTRALAIALACFVGLAAAHVTLTAALADTPARPCPTEAC
jgi:hypothetical protein